MSVLIKDMEKPKSCYAVIDGESEYCPFVNTDDDCVLLLKKGTCDGTWEEQYSKCPLVELPSAQPEQEILSWLLAYHTKSFDLHGRYMPHEVIGWLVHDFANAYMAERREE